MKGWVGAAVGGVTTTTVCTLPVFLTGALVVQISSELHFDPAGLGVVVAVFFGVSALLSLPAGWVVERFGAARTSRVAVAGAAVVMLGLAWLTTSYAALVVLLVCAAWSNPLGQLSANMTLARLVPPSRLGLSFGIKQAAIPAATLLSGAAVPAVALTVGWRWAYVGGAGLALLALLLSPAGAPGGTRKPTGRSGLATGALSVLGVAAGLGASACSALGIFLVASAVDQGVDVGLAGIMLTVGSVVGLSVRLVHGWLADRRDGGHIAVVATSLLLGAGGLALLAVPGGPPLVIGTVLGFGLGWAWPGLLQFAVVQLNPEAPAAATSIVQMGVYAGGLIGPLTFGLLAARLSFPAAWLIMAGVLVAAAVTMLVGRRMLGAQRTGGPTVVDAAA
jgi:MFS family permease